MAKEAISLEPECPARLGWAPSAFDERMGAFVWLMRVISTRRNLQTARLLSVPAFAKGEKKLSRRFAGFCVLMSDAPASRTSARFYSPDRLVIPAPSY